MCLLKERVVTEQISASTVTRKSSTSKPSVSTKLLQKLRRQRSRDFRNRYPEQGVPLLGIVALITESQHFSFLFLFFFFLVHQGTSFWCAFHLGKGDKMSLSLSSSSRQRKGQSTERHKVRDCYLFKIRHNML